MTPTALSLLPPLVVIIAAFLTRNMRYSTNIALGSGIATACLLGARFSPLSAAELAFSHAKEQWISSGHVSQILFLLSIGVLITLFKYSGAAEAFAHSITKRVRSARNAEYFCIALASLLAVDDYLSILTTGHVMQTISDRVGIARLKLAYLVHSFAIATVVLLPFSSWIGIMTGSITNPALSTDSFTTYLFALPFIFYSFFIIIGGLITISLRLPFAQFDSQSKRGSFPTNNAHHHKKSTKGVAVIDLVIPLAILLIGVLLGIPYQGGYYLLGGTRNFLDALQHTSGLSGIMLTSSCIALIFGIGIALFKRTITPYLLRPMIIEGIFFMLPSVVMVSFAMLLSHLLTDVVQTGAFLASLLTGIMPLVLLPVIFFCLAFFNAFISGSAWGTYGLLMPIAIPMTLLLMQLPTPAAITDAPLLIAVLGAIFSGGASGNHLSPISETTIMSATSTQTTPLDHTKTQFIQNIPVFLGTLIAFACVGISIQTTQNMLLSWALSMGTGIITVLVLLRISQRIYQG